LRIFRDPIVAGGGTPFLPPVTNKIQLDQIETRTFASRVIYERYARIRSGGRNSQHTPRITSLPLNNHEAGSTAGSLGRRHGRRRRFQQVLL
jgi:hypothetical protein